MKLSQQTQDTIGNLLAIRRGYCMDQIERASKDRALMGAEADEHIAFWQGQLDKANAAWDEWLQRDAA